MSSIPTATAVLDRYKLQTIFRDEETVSHASHNRVLETTWTRETELGAGSFGEVWRWKEKSSGELRAVKILPRAILKLWKINYVRELEALVKVKDHPDFFTQFLGWFEDKYAVYFAMEYIAHGDLGQYIKERGTMAKIHAKPITSQILQGLEILHENHICHRDLKPQNVLVASVIPIQIKIADFGISAHHQGIYLRTTCGTRAYQAPEQLGLLPQQLQSKRGYTKAVDLWALGVLLHELVTMKLPFQLLHTGSTMLDEDIDTIMLDADRAPEVDVTMLQNYCNGSGPFPVESLKEADMSEEGISFVKSLLVANPKERVSAIDAHRSPWLAGLETTLLRRSQVLSDQFQSLGVKLTRKDLNRVLVNGDRAEILKILDEHLRTMEDTNGMQHRAASNGYQEVVRILLVVTVDTNSWRQGRTLLQSAAGGGHLDTITLLLDRGAEVNYPPDPYHGLTALQAAAEGGHLEAIQLLLHSGANVNAPAAGCDGRTALQAAAEGGHLEAIQLLLQSGANVNAPAADYGGRTALQAAAEGGNLEAIQLLLHSGANVNAPAADDSGRTALQAAAEGGYHEAIQLLLQSGANINAPAADDSGRIALQVAIDGGYLDTIQLLMNSGAGATASQAMTAVQVLLPLRRVATEYKHTDPKDSDAFRTLNGYWGIRNSQNRFDCFGDCKAERWAAKGLVRRYNLLAHLRHYHGQDIKRGGW